MGRIYIKCIRRGWGPSIVRMCIGNFFLVLESSTSSPYRACVVRWLRSLKVRREM